MIRIERKDSLLQTGLCTALIGLAIFVLIRVGNELARILRCYF